VDLRTCNPVVGTGCLSLRGMLAPHETSALIPLLNGMHTVRHMAGLSRTVSGMERIIYLFNMKMRDEVGSIPY